MVSQSSEFAYNATTSCFKSRNSQLRRTKAKSMRFSGCHCFHLHRMSIPVDTHGILGHKNRRLASIAVAVSYNC